MKKESIEKLRTAIERLNTTGDGSEHGFVCDLLKQVLIAEEMAREAKERKFDLFDYTSKDQFRPVMNGVFHQNGYKVASDAHILVALREPYNEEFESKIVLPSGKFVDGPYPKWERVIPKDTDGFAEVKIDESKFKTALKQAREEAYITHGKKIGFMDEWKVKVGITFISARFFDMLIKVMNRIGTDTVKVFGERTAVKASGENGLAIVMPVLASDEQTVLCVF